MQRNRFCELALSVALCFMACVPLHAAPNACSSKSKEALMGRHEKALGAAAKETGALSGQFDKLCSHGESSGLPLWNRVLTELRASLQACPDPITRAVLYSQERTFEKFKRSVAQDCEYSAALKLNPNDARSFYRRGAANFARKDLDRAIADLSEAIRIDPKHAAAYSVRGEAFFAKGDQERAVLDQILAFKADPQYGGDPYFLDGHFESEVAQLLKSGSSLIKDDPKSENGYVIRAAANFHKGDYDASIRDADEAIRINPKSANAYNVRGVSNLRQGKAQPALVDLEMALRLDANSASGLRGRGAAYLETGDLIRALADLNEAIRIQPKGQPAYATRGMVFLRQGKKVEAEADFKQALVLPPNEYLASGLYARTSAAAGLAELSLKSDAPSSQLPQVQLPQVMSSVPALVAPKAVVSQANGKRVALIVANAKYNHVPLLSNPERDGELVAATLRSVGFDSVTLLKNAKKDEIIAALRTFAAQAETSDWAVLYFAGHGMEVGGVNYLLPTDARLASDRDIEFEAVSLNQALNATERANKFRLVILDACRDNPFAAQMKRSLASATRSVTRGLAPLEPEAGTLVVFAAKDGETALDGDGNNSPFTTAFVKNLQTPGLEVRRLFDFVRDDVMEVTNRKQKPFSYGSVSGRQDFFFVPPK